MAQSKPGLDLDAEIASKVFGMDLGWVIFEHYNLTGIRDHHWCPTQTNYVGQPLGRNPWSKEKHNGIGTIEWFDGKAETHQKFGYLNSMKLDLWLGPEKVKPYSTDIAAAWAVVDKLTSQGHHISICFYQKLGPNLDGPPYEAHWSVTGPYKYDGENVSAETAPHAICLAALKVVGI